VAGNLHGLVKIDKENKAHLFFDVGKPVRAIREDKLGNFWVGTEGGGLILLTGSEAGYRQDTPPMKDLPITPY